MQGKHIMSMNEGFKKGKGKTAEEVKKSQDGRHKAFLKRHNLKEEDAVIWQKYQIYKRGAFVRERVFEITFEQFKKFWQKSCNYCGGEILTIGIDRVDSSKGYEIDNLVSACFICNYMKRDFPINIFLEHCERILKFNRLIN